MCDLPINLFVSNRKSIRLSAIVDSGADISLCPKRLCSARIRPSSHV